MRKALSLFLGLLVLFSTLIIETNRVSAEGQDYFLEVDGYTASDLEALLNSTTWVGYAPSITNITDVANGARIYFATEKDMARFLMPTDLMGTFLIDLSKIKAPIPIRVVRYYYSSGYTTDEYTLNVLSLSNFTKIATVYAGIRVEGSGGRDSTLKVNGNAILTVTGAGTGQISNSAIVSSDITWTVHFANGGGSFYLILVFLDEVNFTETFPTLPKGSTSKQYDALLSLVDYVVYFNLKDALTGQSISGVTVKEGNTTLGTIDDGGSLELQKGTHTLTLEKAGYWSETITIDVQSDMNVSVELYPSSAQVTFYLKDALTGESLTGVTVKENGMILGTIDDGSSLSLSTLTNHTLTIEKSGYWSTTLTIEVLSNMNVSVELYPDSAAFKFLNFPSNIQVYENSIYELTFTLTPISAQATYNTYLSLSGLSDVLEVRKDGQLISPEGGKYYLGDIGGDTQVSIKFKATTVGTKAFSITLTSNDAIMSKTYTTSKQVTYEVVPLPFSIQLPEWTVGENSLRIAENSGQNMVLTLSLKDSEGNEVWSDSYSFGPYESYEFTVNIPKEGVYTLEIQFSGTTAVFDINVNPPIQLLTDSITVGKGDVGAIQLLVKNPSSITKYYEVVLTGGFIEGNITKAIAIAPASEKTVEIAFQVPKDVQFDAYDLQIEVLEGNEVLFKGLVHVIIDDSGFSLPIGSGGFTFPLAVGALILIGGAIYVLRRR